jgi:hypothetical protein
VLPSPTSPEMVSSQWVRHLLTHPPVHQGPIPPFTPLFKSFHSLQVNKDLTICLSTVLRVNPPITGFPASQSVPQMQSSSSLHTNNYNNHSQALPVMTQTSFGPAAAPFPNVYPFFFPSPFAGSTFAYHPPHFVQPGMPNYSFQPAGPHSFPHHLLPEPTLPEPPQFIADLQLEGSSHEAQFSAQTDQPTKSKGKGKARAKPYHRKTKNGKKNATEPEEKA